METVPEGKQLCPFKDTKELSFLLFWMGTWWRSRDTQMKYDDIQTSPVRAGGGGVGSKAMRRWVMDLRDSISYYLLLTVSQIFWKQKLKIKPPLKVLEISH